MSRPVKSDHARRPLRPPPSSVELARRGLGHAKLIRAGTEDADGAYRRALTKPWSGRIVERRPYFTSGVWVFIVRLEEKEAA